MRALQERSDFRLKVGHVSRDHVPDNGIIDDVVTVDQDVAKGDDLRRAADAFREIRVIPSQSPDAFADDFEVSLNRLPQEAVRAVFVKRSGVGDVPDKGGRVEDIVEQLQRFRLHRACGACG